MVKTRKAATALAMVAALGCGTSPGGTALDPARCQNPGEFTAYGCVDILGRVETNGGAPIPNALLAATVVLAAAPGRHVGSGGGQADAQGRYALRVQRYVAPIGYPDSVLIWVRAAAPIPVGAPTGTIPQLDSVLVVAALQAPGALAPRVEAPVITLPLQ